MIPDDVPLVSWWWCHTHGNATALRSGCGVAGHCRLIGPYPSALSASWWEDGSGESDHTGR